METLKPRSFYHIYNRGINSSDIFFTPNNYIRFLKRYFYYLYPTAETYAYCLLSNHFHFLIRIRSQEEQEQLFSELKAKKNDDFYHGLEFQDFKPYRTSWQIGHLLNSHTRFINVTYKRTGDLFEGRFKRKEIDSELYLVQMICYIHRNPIHHRITEDYRDYQYSSFTEILSDHDTLLERDHIIN